MERTTAQYFQSLLGTFHCAVVLVYSTSLLTFFWELGSLLLRFPVSDIFGFLSYQLAFALAESVIVAVVVAALVRLLPIRQVRENPTVCGGLFLVSFAISGLFVKFGPQIVQWSDSALPMTEGTAVQATIFFCVFAAIGLPVLAVLLLRNQRIVAFLNTLLEGLSVLGGIYAALGILGMLVIILRNLA